MAFFVSSSIRSLRIYKLTGSGGGGWFLSISSWLSSSALKPDKLLSLLYSSASKSSGRAAFKAMRSSLAIWGLRSLK